MAPLVLDVLVLDEHVLVEDLVVDVVLGRGVNIREVDLMLPAQDGTRVGEISNSK